MSSNQSTITELESKRFEFPVEIKDPKTGLTSKFQMEIDTGNPIALALPRSWSNFFTRRVATVDLSGAGSAQSPAYDAKITRIGDMKIDYDTMAVMTLTDSTQYGLLGIDLLKKMKAEIYDDPQDKKLRLEDAYI